MAKTKNQTILLVGAAALAVYFLKKNKNANDGGPAVVQETPPVIPTGENPQIAIKEPGPGSTFDFPSQTGTGVYSGPVSDVAARIADKIFNANCYPSAAIMDQFETSY